MGGGQVGALPDHRPEPQQRGLGGGRGGWHWSCRLFLLSPRPVPMEVVPRGECKKECLFKLLPAQSWRLETRCTPGTGSAVDKTHLCMSGELLMSTLWTRAPRGTKPKTSHKRSNKIGQNSKQQWRPRDMMYSSTAKSGQVVQGWCAVLGARFLRCRWLCALLTTGLRRRPKSTVRSLDRKNWSWDLLLQARFLGGAPATSAHIPLARAQSHDQPRCKGSWEM